MNAFELFPFLLANAAKIAVPFLSSGLIGGGIAVGIWTIHRLLHTEDLIQDDQWRYDVTRINQLRRTSLIYRLFQPVIQFFAAVNRKLFPESLREIEREVQTAGFSRFWTGGEYLGRIQLYSLFMFPVYIWICMAMMDTPGLVLAAVMSILTVILLRRRLTHQSEYRLLLIKRRMPFLLDLLTLLMEAGSTFLQALKEAVDEYRDHPVGVEFGRVLGEMSMGKTRMEAFESMRARLDDDEITSIVGSIIQGEQLGTPLASIFRTQADVLRIKRTQRAETLAAEAGVKMLLPAILVMAASVIVILGPFMIAFMYADFGW